MPGAEWLHVCSFFFREHHDFRVCSEANQSVGEIAEYAAKI